MKIFDIDKKIMFNKDLFLRKSSRDISAEEIQTNEFKEIVEFMFEALYENSIGVGLAAPQIGLMINLIVIDIKRNGKSPLVLINPKFVPLTDEKIYSSETCLSFEMFAGNVLRYSKIKVIAKNINFDNIEFVAENFLAFVCQHEIDHLNGNVYIDKSEIEKSESHEKFLAKKAMENLKNTI